MKQISNLQEEYTRRGAVSPGTLVPVLMSEGKCLHWRAKSAHLGGHLPQVYHQLGKLVHPGGIVLNGDDFDFGLHMPTFRLVAEAMQERARGDVASQNDVEDWSTWWERLKSEPGMEDLFAERKRRFIDGAHHDSHTLMELHEAALRDAGFREVGVIWQHMGNRVVMGVR